MIHHMSHNIIQQAGSDRCKDIRTEHKVREGESVRTRHKIQGFERHRGENKITVEVEIEILFLKKMSYGQYFFLKKYFFSLSQPWLIIIIIISQI